MRKLATTRIIKDILPHPNADFLAIAVIDGWKVVVRKDEEIKKGDTIVYFEIDSYLPIEERYEFLRKYSYKKIQSSEDDPGNEGFRIRTIRLRGEYSQGLIMQLSAFEDEIISLLSPGSFAELEDVYIMEGMDLTEVLDIKVYTPPIPAEMKGKIKGHMPSFIPKTEQERIQNHPEFFDEYKDVTFEETEKLNGTSMTVYRNEGIKGVCGRNYEFSDDNDNIYIRKARELELIKHLDELGKNIVLQGELMGESIQSNTLGIQGRKFFLFDVYDIDKKRYMTQYERLEIYNFLRERCNIEHVPIIETNVKVLKICDMDILIKISDGVSLLNKSRNREGLVFKSIEPIDGNIVSFKVVSNNYLVKTYEKLDKIKPID